MSNRKKVDVTTLVPGAQDRGEEETPQASSTVHMHLVAGNPDNPRSVDDYTDSDPEFVELKRSMEEVGQLQPIGVVSRDAWLARKPEHAKQIGKAQYVVFGGNRRLAAAKALRWTLIDIRVQDHLAEPGQGDEDRLDEAVIIENIHRKNLAPVKEAELLRRMVERHGSQEKVAERIGKSQMYVSHRLSLLKLAPDIQQQVDAGQVKLKAARQLASRTSDHAEQRARLMEVQATPKLADERRQDPPLQNPVLKPPAAEAVPGSEGPPSSVARDSSPMATVEQVRPMAAVPDPRPEPEQLQDGPPAPPQIKMPWRDGTAAMDIAFERLTAFKQRPPALARYFELVGGPEQLAQDFATALDREERAALIEALKATL